MEYSKEDYLLKKSFKKIKRNYIENIFSKKSKTNITRNIMSYLDIKSRYEFAKTCIYTYNNFIDFENLIIPEKIKEISNKNICKIFLKDNKIINGFLAYHIHLYLIINHNPIDEILENKILKIIVSNDLKEIDLTNRKIFEFNEYNILFIVIEKYYGYGFDYKMTNNESYIDQPIYILHYFDNKKNFDVSFGILNYTNENEFKIEKYFNYLYSIDNNNNCSKGDFIFNLSNDRIIGIQQESDDENKDKDKDKDKYNKGMFFSPILNIINDIDIMYKWKAKETKFEKRLIKEIKSVIDIPYVDIHPTEQSLKFQGIILGPDDSPYKNGCFEFTIYLSYKHPIVPPLFNFKTKIYHPNINNKTGTIGLDLLNRFNWNPETDLAIILKSIYSLLSKPNWNKIISSDVKNDSEYEKIAKEWTEEYALIC